MDEQKPQTEAADGQSELTAGLGTDWKEVAYELARRINYVLTYCPPKNSAMMLNMQTGEATTVRDFLADGMEMLPGVKVDRERLHMTPTQRKKAEKAKGA